LRPTIANPPKLRPTKGQLLSKPREIIKIPRPPNPRKRQEKQYSAFHNGQNNCKESVKLAKTLHIPRN
jgi:hypothetical protein